MRTEMAQHEIIDRPPRWLVPNGVGGVCGVGGVGRFGLLWVVRVWPVRGWKTKSLGLRQAQSGSPAQKTHAHQQPIGGFRLRSDAYSSSSRAAFSASLNGGVSPHTVSLTAFS